MILSTILSFKKTCKIKQSVWNHLQFTEENPRNSRIHVVGDLTSYLTLKKTYSIHFYRCFGRGSSTFTIWHLGKVDGTLLLVIFGLSSNLRPGFTQDPKNHETFSELPVSPIAGKRGNNLFPNQKHPKSFPRFVVNPSSKTSCQLMLPCRSHPMGEP